MEHTHKKNIQLTDELIINIREIAVSFSNIERILIFGSRARKTASERADIDLAVDAPNLSSDEWRHLKETVQNLKTLLKIDIVLLQKISNELKSNILKEGIELYVKEK